MKTVLNLLKEVAASDGQKIDWNEIVKNTTTGISSARECQMLWRHLAYGQTLIDQLDDAANPLVSNSILILFFYFFVLRCFPFSYDEKLIV